MTPIGLYVHFPFCRARCHYCAFYFVVGREKSRRRYLAAVEREIERASSDPRFARRPVHSIYFGGGTPSLADPALLGRVVDRATASFPVLEDAEISLEANPDGLTADRLRALRAAGCNRLTLGWQSLRAGHLKALTRTHTAADNRRALEAARRAGFENVGVDMIFGLPGQTTESWSREIGEVARLAPDHVSAYELTLEEGTRFFARARDGRVDLPDEDTRAELFEETEDVLGAHGILRYEISNFARPGRECRHNVAGWRSGDLLGVGASAASHAGRERWTNVADLDEYVSRIEAGDRPAGPLEALDDETWAAEDLYLGLRLRDGIDAGDRLSRVGAGARARLGTVLDRAERAGLIARDGGVVRLTRGGRLLADGVFEELLTGSALTAGSAP